MTKDLVSVIIPCYNVEKFVDDCVETLKNQTLKNFEAIFVNDGSKDGTLKKLEGACLGISNFRIIDKPNGGVSTARNAGIKEAKGEFLCFVDSDDILSPFYLETLFSNIKKHDADYSVGALKFKKESFANKDVSTKRKGKTVLYEDKENLLAQLYSTNVFDVSSCNKMFRHEKLKQMEGYPDVFVSDITYGEDLDFNFRYLTNCEKAIYSSEKIYFYRLRKGSAVQSKFNEKMLTVFIGHNRNLKICEEKYPSAIKYVRAFISISCVEMLFRMYHCKYQNSKKIRELYYEMKENKKFVSKSKKIQWYKRLSPCASPILRILLNKHFKEKKNKA